MVVEDEENAFRLLIASPKWTYCWIQENWMKLCWCWNDKVIFGMLVVLPITLLYYILMGWQGLVPPPPFFSLLSSPLLSSTLTQHPKPDFSFIFHPTQNSLLNSFSFPYVGFCFLSQFSKVTQHRPSPHHSIPLNCWRDTCWLDLDLELDSFLLKSPLALTFSSSRIGESSSMRQKEFATVDMFFFYNSKICCGVPKGLDWIGTKKNHWSHHHCCHYHLNGSCFWQIL